MPSCFFAYPRVFRDFTFPRHLKTVDRVEMEGDANPATVGSVRVLHFRDDAGFKKQRLIELSDQYFRIAWELEEACTSPLSCCTVLTLFLVPPSEVMGSISSISLIRITEHNQTLVQWESNFSSDVKPDLIRFEQAGFLSNLQELRAFLSQ